MPISQFEKFISQLPQDEKTAGQIVVAHTATNPEKNTFGGTHNLYALQSQPDLVVKRVKPHAQILDRTEGDLNRAIARLKEEHRFVTSYLAGYVPKTVYLEANFGNCLEWFMLQERAEGEDPRGVRSLARYFTGAGEKVNTAFILNFHQFRDRYRRMRLAGRVIEDQVKIDLSKNKIWLYDTNFLVKKDQRMNAQLLFDLIGDQPLDQSSEEIWKCLQRNFAIAKQIDLRHESAFLKEIGHHGRICKSILEQLRQMQARHQFKGHGDLNDDTIDQLWDICDGLAYFPPERFKDNIFTLELAEKLGIQAELAELDHLEVDEIMPQQEFRQVPQLQLL